MLRNMQGWQLVIIILAIIILIGWKRLPDAARSLGRSMRIFKSEVEQMGSKSDDETPSAASTDTVDSQPGDRPSRSSTTPSDQGADDASRHHEEPGPERRDEHHR